MKAPDKPYYFLATILLLMVIGSCGKYQEESIELNAAVGKFYCVNDTSWTWGGTRGDTVLGHDVVTVQRSGAADIIVNDERFTYDSNLDIVPFTHFSNGTIRRVSYVQFFSNYDSIVYVVHAYYYPSGSSCRQYRGHRI